MPYLTKQGFYAISIGFCLNNGKRAHKKFAEMLGDELKKARLKAGLTQEQVAAQARISREYVSQLERTRQSPTVDMLLRVCRILQVPASRLIGKVERGQSEKRSSSFGNSPRR